MNFKKYHVSRNLFDSTILQNNKGISSNGNVIDQSGRIATVTPINVSGHSAVTLTYAGDNVSFIYATFNSGTLVKRVAGKESGYTINTTNCDLLYICFYGLLAITKDDVSKIMLNTGSTAIPYEPYSSEVWHDSHYIHNTSTDTITTLPAVLYPNATTATVELKGNTVQSGTPTPTNPVDVVGVGERTKNYFDKDNIDLVNLYPNNSTGAVEQSSTVWSIIVPIDSGGEWIFWIEDTTTNRIRIAGYETYPVLGSQATFIDSAGTSMADYKYNVFEVPEGTKYILIMLSSNQYTQSEMQELLETVHVQIEKGVRKTDYEPHGYKIPISSAGQTIPVYLGEVQSTRRIKKLVLDGTESWRAASGRMYLDALSDDYIRASGVITCICTHYSAQEQVGSASRVNEGCITLGSDPANQRLYIYDTNISTASDFKTYLQQQYAAGTPVTVWYVLATPETAVVNEPLMKIGDYANTVSNVSIPVTAGGDTLSVDTTVQPSEVTVNYKGWHPIQNTHEKSKNLFDMDAKNVNNGYITNGFLRSDGSITTNIDYRVSEYINISQNQQYTLFYGSNLNLPSVCFYDSTKNYISGVAYAGHWNVPFTTPQNAEYLRLSFRAVDPASIMLNEGSTPLPYEPYWK